MSNEFYRAIARRLVHFFRSRKLAGGERYWLRLDNQEMVEGINSEIKKMLLEQEQLGEYSFTYEQSNMTYKTYTLELPQTRVVFVFQQDGMKKDYLATLRNEIPKLGYISVYLVLEKLDTVDSATKLLSDPGMPFHEDSLKESIREIINGDSFSPGDRTFLDNALKNMEEDRFSDKSSVSGYETFLSISERGEVNDEDYNSFRMLPDHGYLNTCTEFNDKKTIERLVENADVFERIDQAFSRDEIKEKLGGQYKRQFIDNLLKKKSDDLEWQTGITFKEEQSSRKRDSNKTDIELNSDFDEAVYLVDGNPMRNTIADCYSKPEGERKAEGRRRHIIAFVPEDAETVEFAFESSSPVPKSLWTSGRNTDNVSVTATQARVRIQISLEENATFARVEIQKNKLCFAIIKANAKYFVEIVSKYSIDFRKKKTPSLLVDVVDGKLTINPTAEVDVQESVANAGCYTCFDDQKLTLKISDEAISESIGNVCFDVVCGGCKVPLSVKQDIRQPSTLDAIDLYREKTLSKRSYRWISENRLQLGTAEFAIKDKDLMRRLDAEFEMVQNGWFSANYANGELTGREIVGLPERLQSAIQALFSKLCQMGIGLSLAYVDDPEIQAEIKECSAAYEDAIMTLPEGSHGYEGLLEIGVVYIHDNLMPQEVSEIRFTALHPINIAYQKNLKNIGDLDCRGTNLANVAIARLVHNQAIPYIYFKDTYFEASDITAMPEWAFYYKIDSVRARALGDTVARITRERIEDFLNHFHFLFSAKSQKSLRLACYNLGTCEDILVGVSEYLFKELFKPNQSANEIISIHVDCYGDPLLYTAFENLLDKETLRTFLTEKSLLKKRPGSISEYECLSLLLSHLSFSLHSSDAEKEYAHIAFIPGGVGLIPRTDVDTGSINTGIMLNGAVAASAATEQSGFFVTGYGTKDMATTDFTSVLTKVNQLHASAYTHASLGDSTISVAVSKEDESSFDDIYQSANWVVLLDPKVDPMHFTEKDQGQQKLLVIHYEDREASNGYNAITVTRKTSQYEGVISEALAGVSSGSVDEEHVRDVVDFANAFNGTWLLSFLHSDGTQTPRSRMSMLAAVKASLTYYRNDAITWVPLSLEEILRISTGLGLTAATEINSWKNLGFEREPMSDDILLVGLLDNDNGLEVILHPVEVKVGNCTENELNKGVEQALKTYSNFLNSYQDETGKNLLSTKIARNAFMQKVLISAEKMKAYKVLVDEDWDYVITGCKKALQNEEYRIIDAAQANMPKGTVCAFSATALSPFVGNRRDVRLLIMPEAFIPDITIGSTQSLSSIVGIYDFDILASNEDEDSADVFYADPEISGFDNNQDENTALWDALAKNETSTAPLEPSNHAPLPTSPSGDNGIAVHFGTNLLDGTDVIWEPCNTSKLFHSNTGIIGTMGTGKTQFTKSLIAQMYCNRNNNPVSGDLGILIFDYKGDYNLSQKDFIEATGAKVYRPYKLPFNPLSINKSENSVPLLPKHIANTFKDTLFKACANSKLGAVQENTLRRFILEAYELKGISPSDPSTWDREPPTFETIYRLYMDDEETKKNDSLASIMDKIHEFELFESDPSKTMSLFDALEGVTVIDLSGFDQDIQNLVVGIMIDLFYSQMQASGHSAIQGNLRQLTKMILVDEADNFLGQNMPSLKKILKEGREFGVGVILSTQFLKHFKSKTEDYSKYILTWVVHSVADLDPSDIRFVFNTEAKSSDENYLFGEVKKLRKHCSIVKLGESTRPTPMRDLAFWELIRDKKL